MHGTGPLKTHKQKEKRPLHSGSLKEVEKKKNEARKARRRDSPAEVVHSLAKHFFSWVRTHSHLKRVSAARLMTRNARVARMQCYKDFSRCAKEILDGSAQQIVPKFSNTTACQFFTEVYHSGPRNFVQPEWMSSPSHPEVEMDCSPFSANEVVRVIKKLKSASAPSPYYDRVGCVVFKKCPALISVLLHLFNICWTQSVIPREWKSAVIKLIFLLLPPLNLSYSQC